MVGLNFIPSIQPKALTKYQFMETWQKKLCIKCNNTKM